MYRVNGTQFQPGQTKSINRFGRTSHPVLAWFACSGAGAITRIQGRLTASKIHKDLRRNPFTDSLGEILNGQADSIRPGFVFHPY
jgi:thiol:disulfide interchange protein